jgi:hypothetical protein
MDAEVFLVLSLALGVGRSNIAIASRPDWGVQRTLPPYGMRGFILATRPTVNKMATCTVREAAQTATDGRQVRPTHN